MMAVAERVVEDVLNGTALRIAQAQEIVYRRGDETPRAIEPMAMNLSPSQMARVLDPDRVCNPRERITPVGDYTHVLDYQDETGTRRFIVALE